jgi:predicted NBD/HSP70 family sugar kinase
VIGVVDLGRTRLRVGVVEDGGRLSRVVSGSAKDPEAFERLCGTLETARGGAAFDAVCMAVPGPFDRRTQTLVEPTGVASEWHAGWAGLALGDLLSRRFRCATYVESDANCAALGEAYFGAGRRAATSVVFMIGTGVGMGAVQHGRLYVGRNDTEGGHQILWPRSLGGPRCECGAYGCLETLVGGSALRRRYGRGGEEIDDPAIWDEVGRWLGLAVVNTTALLDPDVIIFGGGVCERWSLMAPAIERTLAEELILQPPPLIRRSELGQNAGLLGASVLAGP